MNEDETASIIPFAQSEIVHRFLRGIDPEYKNDIGKYLERVWKRKSRRRLTRRRRSSPVGVAL